MNLSGVAVSELVRYFRVGLADLLVVADDVTCRSGGCGRAAGSDGGHHGLASIVIGSGPRRSPG